MSEPIRLSTKTVLKAPQEVIWAFLADTERLNRALQLPSVKFVPVADASKKGHYSAETRVLGKKLAYEEFPFDWVENRYYKVLRKFSGGPLVEIVCGIRIRPTEGGTELEAFADVTPRNWLAAAVAKFSGKKAAKDMLQLVQAFEAHVRDAAPNPALPKAADLHEDVLDFRMGSFRSMKAAERLRRHLVTGSDLEVLRMRPFELADAWKEERMAVLKLFLHAAKSGVLDITWSVLCPNCRMAAREHVTLSQMKAEAHCATCGIGFGADLSKSVEARFRVNPAVRPARRETYCIGGPANMPGIVAQLRLEPGEERTEEVELAPGTFRVRCYQAAGLGIFPADGTGAGSMDVACEAGGLRVSEGPVKAGVVSLKARNRLDREALVVLERDTWRETAATAAMVTSFQEFRDLFPAEAVAPGDEIGISSLAVLFTDLKGSTELYQRIGDGKAFAFVQNHFRYLVEAVAEHRGGVVKTMGDAVMASFASGRDAVASALRMQEGWASFRRDRPEMADVLLKIGIHLGPSIAINNAGRLDYFGTTVNMAARVQGQSAGDDVVVSRALAEDPETAAFLRQEGLPAKGFRAVLKGLEGEHELVRLRLKGKAK